jgi:hypothetical protein
MCHQSQGGHEMISITILLSQTAPRQRAPAQTPRSNGKKRTSKCAEPNDSSSEESSENDDSSDEEEEDSRSEAGGADDSGSESETHNSSADETEDSDDVDAENIDRQAHDDLELTRNKKKIKAGTCKARNLPTYQLR